MAGAPPIPGAGHAPPMRHPNAPPAAAGQQQSSAPKPVSCFNPIGDDLSQSEQLYSQLYVIPALQSNNTAHRHP